MHDSEVLIVGAGPTGLVLALWLTHFGVSVRIIDRTAGPGTTSRALGVQPRTLELYRQLGLDEPMIALGHKAPGFNFWVQGRRRGRIPFAGALELLTPYPFVLIVPQDEHERLLVDRLAAVGVTVERETGLLDFEQDGNGVRARLQGPGGETTLATRFLAGCDGARSSVRERLGIGFPGGTYDRFFYVADLDASGPAVDGEVHINLDTAADFLAVFPLADRKRVRLVGTVLDDRPGRQETLTFDDISPHAVQRLKVQVAKVNWFSTYRVHHRVADHFRVGRAFLLGDAGHIHSPAGGQGMNTGIGDAVNLAWKLAAVLHGRAADTLLDSYEAERIGFARRLVATTDRVFTVATSSNQLAQVWRTRILPFVVPLVSRIPAVRRFGFRTVSQLALTYRHSPLSAGRVGRICGGDRLPWVPAAPGDDAPSPEARWQLHAFGQTGSDLEEWCQRNELLLRRRAWSQEAGRAGFRCGGVYLVRPDGYVALATRDGSSAALTAYQAQCSLPTTKELIGFDPKVHIPFARTGRREHFRVPNPFKAERVQ